MILYEIKGHALICFGLNISAKQTEHFSLRFSIFYVLPHDVALGSGLVELKKPRLLKYRVPQGIFFLILSKGIHCVKSVQIKSFFWSIFSCIRTESSVQIKENTNQKKLRIWTLFTQWNIKNRYSSFF